MLFMRSIYQVMTSDLQYLELFVQGIHFLFIKDSFALVVSLLFHFLSVRFFYSFAQPTILVFSWCFTSLIEQQFLAILPVLLIRIEPILLLVSKFDEFSSHFASDQLCQRRSCFVDLNYFFFLDFLISWKSDS